MARAIALYGVGIRDSIATGNLDKMKELAVVSAYLLKQRDDAEAGTDDSKAWEAAHKELLNAIQERETLTIVPSDIVAIKDGIIVLDSISVARALSGAAKSDAEGFYCELKIGWK